VSAAGLKTIVQVQDLEGARAAIRARPDALIAQGNEAGGHTGRRGTLAFAAQVLDLAGDVPVLVAGGIATGRGVAAALGMGAAGAVLGTRFKASEEFECADALKAAIVSSDGGDTIYDEIVDDACGLDWPRHVTGRVLRNRFTADGTGGATSCARKVATYPPFGFMAELVADPTRNAQLGRRVVRPGRSGTACRRDRSHGRRRGDGAPAHRGSETGRRTVKWTSWVSLLGLGASWPSSSPRASTWATSAARCA
jgi:NAD(P)H-dependent flavin oxidoreductase YrpB (nitropropane dioxygenase family)